MQIVFIAMSRPLRIEYPGAWYHVMNRGRARQKVFLDDDDRKDFLTLLSETVQMWSIHVHAFCLLDNHYHLLIHTPRGNLSRSMRHANGIYTQHFNRKHGRDGSLFRGRFKAILIDADSYLLEVVRYIHLNPVKAKLVKDPHAYLWTSHRTYLERRPSLNWLNRDEVFGRFGARWDQAVDRYTEFIHEGIPSHIEGFYAERKAPVILGGQRFKAWVRAQFSEKGRADYEISQAKVSPLRPEAGQVIDAVKRSYRVGTAMLTRVRRGQWNEPRDVAIYLCRKQCGLSLKEIGAELGITVYTTVSMARRRVEAKLAKDRQFRQRVEGLLRTVQA